nr:MAG TPA: hypothetical protein [Caudoviricetes sp.]
MAEAFIFRLLSRLRRRRQTVLPFSTAARSEAGRRQPGPATCPSRIC